MAQPLPPSPTYVVYTPSLAPPAMLLRGAVVLATAALHAHAVAATSLRVSSIGQFDEVFDDFYVPEPYDFSISDPSPTSLAMDQSQPRRWAPATRNDDFPFRGPQGPNRKTHWDNRMLIVPSKKMAFCYIEKNACTQFNKLFNALNGYGFDPHDDNPFWKSNSDSKDERIRSHFRKNISKANGWKMAIFLRDPAERFLSAWLSKCDAWEHGGIDCLGPQITNMSESKKVELFEKTVVELLPKYIGFVDAVGFYNAHYDPQHVFCDGRRLEEYDFVGKLSGPPAHIQEQVVDMLKREAGTEDSDPLMDLIRKLFPSESAAGHGTGSASLMKQFYRNRTIYNRVVKAYASDYRWASSTLSPSSLFTA